MLTVTFSWGWLLLTVDELWTFHQFEHPSVLIRETNHTKHLQWSLPISTRILILPSSSLDSLAAPLTAFGHSHFGFAWSQWEEGTWKQTPVRPETPNWFTLALLLAGVSSGLRTAEKATIWLHVWVYFICFPLALPLPTTSDNGRWLPYLQALIQGSYLPFEAQAACKAWGLHQP